MTYCVGIRLDAGLVFMSDSRTNAGLDQISTYRKMMIYERPGDRFMVMLSAGNLSISQSVREIQPQDEPAESVPEEMPAEDSRVSLPQGEASLPNMPVPAGPPILASSSAWARGEAQRRSRRAALASSPPSSAR